MLAKGALPERLRVIFRPLSKWPPAKDSAEDGILKGRPISDSGASRTNPVFVTAAVSGDRYVSVDQNGSLHRAANRGTAPTSATSTATAGPTKSIGLSPTSILLAARFGTTIALPHASTPSQYIH